MGGKNESGGKSDSKGGSASGSGNKLVTYSKTSSELLNRPNNQSINQTRSNFNHQQSLLLLFPPLTLATARHPTPLDRVAENRKSSNRGQDLAISKEKNK